MRPNGRRANAILGLQISNSGVTKPYASVDEASQIGTMFLTSGVSGGKMRMDCKCPPSRETNFRDQILLEVCDELPACEDILRQMR